MKKMYTAWIGYFFESDMEKDEEGNYYDDIGSGPGPVVFATEKDAILAGIEYLKESIPPGTPYLHHVSIDTYPIEFVGEYVNGIFTIENVTQPAYVRLSVPGIKMLLFNNLDKLGLSRVDPELNLPF